MSGKQTALTPLAAPTTVGNYTAATSGIDISEDVKIALNKTPAATTQVAIFATSDSTIASGSIAGTFSETNSTTWPNGGVGVRYLGSVKGGPTVVGSTPINTALYLTADRWEPYYIALRVLGTAAASVEVSGVGDPTGAGGSSWLIGGQATPDPALLGPTNGSTFRLIAGSAITVLESDGDTTSLSGNGGVPAFTASASAVGIQGPNGHGVFSTDGIATGIGAQLGAESLALSAGTGGVQIAAAGAGSVDITPGSTSAIRILPRTAGASNTSELQFFELAASGSNYIGLKAQDALAGNTTYVLPADGSVSGQVLSTNAAGILAWGSGIALGGTAALALTSGSSGAASLDSGTTGAVNVGTGATAKTTTLGSVTGAAVTALRAGSGALTLVRNGVTWTWPSADGVAGGVGGGNVLNSNGSGTLSFTQFQSGTATLTSGTVTLAANITASSRIVFSLKGNPAALTTQMVAPSGSRSVGTPGSFVINGLVAALTVNGADNTTTFDWFIIG